MEIRINDFENEAYKEKIYDLLITYNREKTKDINEINKPLEIIAFENNKIIGGIYGRSIWGTLEIKTFVVDELCRGKGIGTKLILEAENEAFQRNCRYISLDTFSFQAPKFYERLGFELIGTETDFPKGFEKYYYRKSIK